MPQPNRRTLAYHEAGHAIVAKAMGCWVKEVSLKPGDNYFARAVIPNKPDFQSELPESASQMEKDNARLDEIRAEMLILLGGISAEARLAGRDEVNEDAPEHNPDGDAVYERAEFLATCTRQTRNEAIADNVIAAAEVVHQHWPAIRALAGELLAQTTVGGELVDEVFRQSPKLAPRPR